MDGVPEQQAVRLADEFLHELVHELDHEDIVGITLGAAMREGQPPCIAMSIWLVSGAKE
jgi:hypothetical protein